MKNEKTNNAFTLIELLVVISIITTLLGVMLPCLGRAKSKCRAVVCKSNIRQLFIANTAYALSNDDFYVRAAKDIEGGSGGRYRWHGVRKNPYPSVNDPFDPSKGPLASYLGDGKVKKCPLHIGYTKNSADAFETGNGGYGYNLIGVGSRTYTYGAINPESTRTSMNINEIDNPDQKVMFTDTAFVKKGQLIEYSFCEPYMWVLDFGSGIKEFPGAIPSIHFRHIGKTNVVWCDGHVSSEAPTFPEDVKNGTAEYMIGWFGPKDNSLFKPR